MKHPGEVIVFQPEDGRSPLGNYVKAIAEAKRVLSRPGCNLHDPQLFEQYYQGLWQNCDLDARQVEHARDRLDYPKVAKEFQMIRDGMTGIVVPYGDPGAQPILDKIKWKGCVSGRDWRALQPYTVNIYSNDFLEYSRQGLIEEITDGLHLWRGDYGKCGLSDDVPDPADLIVG